ncbi:MAG: TetR/AcrR family transcriptional regulator, partial [Spongiibacteraceae bacterium]
MTQTPVDRRILRSRKAIQAAMQSLLEENRPFSQITVSELAERADVTRKTFYAHYSSPEDVVRAICWQLLESVLVDVDEKHLMIPISESGFGEALFNSVV